MTGRSAHPQDIGAHCQFDVIDLVDIHASDRLRLAWSEFCDKGLRRAAIANGQDEQA